MVGRGGYNRYSVNGDLSVDASADSTFGGSNPYKTKKR